MPIPNIATLYQRIRRGSEGGDEFARLLDLLLAADCTENGHPFETPDDAAGDAFGVDAYTAFGYRSTSGLLGYQYKFYPSPLSAKHRADIERSAATALERHTSLRRWILITPEDFMKGDVEWWESMPNSLSADRRRLVRFEHWGHTRLVELALRHPHVGRRYFPELFEPPANPLVIANLTIDQENCDWYRVLFSNTICHQYMPYYMKFVEANDVVVPLDALAPSDREAFEAALHWVKKRAVNCHDSDQGDARLRSLIDIELDGFYKAMVLMGRLGSRIDSLGAVYDARERNPFRDSRYAAEYYVYNIDEVRAVRDFLPMLWEEGPEYEKLPGQHPLRLFKRMFLRTTNPIFDCVLLNNTSTTVVLIGLELIIDRVWTEIKAGPPAQTLRAVHTYRFDVDFNEPVNPYAFEPPIAFGSEQPARFKVQFERFMERCPGNCAEIRLRFRTAEYQVESERLLLDF